jgi:DNA-binding MarR family transcriptional regulator
MTSIAKRLERKGYIANATSPLDQRVKLVTLTQEGRQLANEWRGIMQAMLSRVEEVLTPQELEHSSNAQGRACVPR